DHKVAALLQYPNETRTRLGKGQYLTREPGNILGQLEQTLEDIIACEPIFEKICRELGQRLPFYQLDLVAAKGLAANIITEKEAALLTATEISRKATIDVDDFDSDDLKAG
ncbi:MAG: acyl-CoA dehydrogenase, partial [Psychroserpens sp.]